MKVQIARVVTGGPAVRVSFSCQHGTAVAHWVGVLPTIGDDKYIELELPPALLGDRDVVAPTTTLGLRQAGDETTVVGEITSVAHGLALVDIGGTTLEVDLQAGSMPEVGKRYSWSTSYLAAFDSNY
jgi:hypothetical protein